MAVEIVCLSDRELNLSFHYLITGVATEICEQLFPSIVINITNIYLLIRKE